MDIDYLIKQHKAQINALKGRREQIKDDLELCKEKKEEAREESILLEKSQTIFQLVSQKTLDNLKYHISELGSLALSDIFDDPYKLKLNFVQKRNKNECEILFEKNGEVFDPLKSSGGGAIDVASFALRISLWAISNPKKRNVIILDEPLKFLSKDLQHKAGSMIQKISEKLDIQIIMVTHEFDLISKEDKIFRIEQINSISKVVLGT